MKKKKYEEPEMIEEVDLDQNIEDKVKKSKGARIANIVINVILVVAIIIAAVCTYVSFVSTSGNGVPSIFGIEMLSIQTNSMYPFIEEGDLIFDTRIKDPKELKIGDVITYWTVIDGERVLNTHRIEQIYDGGTHLVFATKGDANDSVDPLNVHESSLVGIYSGKKINGAGKVFDFLQTSTGFLIVVVVPVAIFFIFHLIQFFRVLFEYQSVKNKLAYEQERGKAEDALDEEKKKFESERDLERARLEAELREKLKAEMLEEEEKKAAEEAKKAAEREALEAEIRAKVIAEMEAKAAEATGEKENGPNE